jgi:peptidoglycan/xylan/chitin deacetylase (PgdA/CDA1 family)
MLRRHRRLLRLVVVLVALVLAIQVVWWAEPVWLFSFLEVVVPGIVWRVPTNDPVVALSFDDGPNPEFTPQVLAVLAANRAHATFFLIGDRAAAHPEIVAAIRAGGHEIGNHYLHRGTTLLDSEARFEENLLHAEQVVGLDRRPKLFRPPSGLGWPWQLRRARELGYICVLGSAYPHDPAHPPVGYIEWLIKKNMVPGAVVILHDGISDPRHGIQALPGILSEGQRRGLRFVTVGELLGHPRGRRTRG